MCSKCSYVACSADPADCYVCSDDGRVTFHCPGYFKAAFTLGGDALTDQWYLVDFAFDFKSRECMLASLFFVFSVVVDVRSLVA